jgi:hypothetical protein
MCANKLKLCFYHQVEKLMYMEPCKKISELKNTYTLFCELSPTTHSFLLLTDNVQGLNEAVHMVTMRFQHFWPQLGCLILRNFLKIGSFNLYVNDISSVVP